MKILSFIAFQIIFISGAIAQIAGVESDYKSERIRYLKSELNLNQDQVRELTIRFREIVPEKSAADWKKTRAHYEQILLEVLNISQQKQLAGTPGLDNQCFVTRFKKSTPTASLVKKPVVAQNSLALAPNPTTDFVTLSYEIRRAGNITIELKDELGKTVDLIVNGHRDLGNYSKRLDMTNLASSIYFITLSSGNQIISEKLILQR